MKTRFILATLLSGVTLATAGPILPAFTYHGLLTSGGARANGSFDFQFSLYSALDGGSQQGTTFSTNSVPVRDGSFMVTLDFGDIFDGNRRWLEMAMRSHGDAAYTLLSPRTEILATPHALYSLRAQNATVANSATIASLATVATTANSVADDAVRTSNLRNGAVTPPKLSTDGVLPGQILRFNGSQWIYERYPTYAAGTGLSLSDDAFSIPAGAVTLDMLNPAGAGPDAVIKFNGVRWALGSDNAGPSYRAGAGLTVDGSTFSIANRSVVNAMLALGSITPDLFSSAGASDGQVLKFNGAAWGFAADNTGPAYSAGPGLTLDGAHTFALGTVPVDHLSTSGAGAGQVLTYNGSTAAWASPVGGGSGWALTGNSGTTAGAQFLGTTDFQPLELKVNNQRVLRLQPAIQSDGFPLPGYVAAPNVIAGHRFNTVGNEVIGATISGGGYDGLQSFGDSYFSSNRVQSSYGAIGGGAGNIAGNGWGGSFGIYATVSGGQRNIAFAEYSTVPGGQDNEAGLPYSFAAGHRAKARSAGSFVWADDSTPADFVSSVNNQFLIRAAGGVGIGTGAPQGQLHVNAATASGGANTATFTAPAIGPQASHIHYGPTGDWYIRSANSGGNVILQDTGGKVGVGNPAPEWPLDVRAPQAVGRFVSTANSFGSVVELRNDSSAPGYLGAINFNNGANATPGQIAYDASGAMAFRVEGAERMRIAADGNVSVSVLTITGGADLAEPFLMSNQEIPKGAVVVIDDKNAGRLKLSDQAYDQRVAGIVSGANGIKPGIALHQEGALEGGQNVALSGRVYVQADASRNPIKPGDLLTTSDVPGHAMKVTDHTRAQGAILGKAMSNLEGGRGFVLVLVSLQ